MAEENKDNTQTHIVLTKGTMVSHYRVIERIGAGGMGEVYLTEDTKLDRKVALKFLSYQHNQNEELKTRFMREAQAVAKLSHPNIVHIYEVSEYQNRPFFAMEHVEGLPLHKYIAEESLTFSEILSIATGICEGLSKAHQLGIVHRDIKTSNIVLNNDGHPKILDFGLATIIGTEKITKEGSTIGTVAYMSPERAQGKRADHRSDLFSFGVVLYEMICGRTPFRRDTEAATLNSIVHDSAEPLARYKANVPEGIQKIVEKLLEKTPQTRYQSAADVVADLAKEKRFLDSVSFSPTPHSVFAVKSKSSKSKLILSSFTVLIILVLLLVLKPWKFSISPNDEAEASENRLAIMYFDNLIDPTDSARIGEIVTNLLITDLSESEHLRVVSSQRMYDIFKQLGKEGSHSIDRQTATQVADIAGAKWMLTGTVLQMEPSVVITTQIVEVSSGQVEASQRSTSSADDDIFAQVDKLSADIRNDLAVPGLSGGESDKSLSQVTTESPEAYRYYLEGIDYARKLYRKEAITSFEKAIELDSTFAMAYYHLALSWGRSDLTVAEEKIRAAVKYSNNATRLQRMHILAASDGLNGDFESAEAALKEIVKEFPDDMDAYLNLALIHRDFKDNLDTAVYYLKEAHKIAPGDKLLYNNLAYAYKDLREYDKAIDALDKYIAIVPNEPNPYDSRGEMYASAGKFDLAIESYRLALTKDPEFYGALFRLIPIFCQLGDYERADSCAEALAKSDEKEIRARGRTELVISILYQGKFIRALQVLDEGMEADLLDETMGFHYAFKLMNKGFVKSLLGRNEEALEDIREARRIIIQTRPEDHYAFGGIYAVVLAKQGRIALAKSSLDEAMPAALKQNDKIAEAMFNIGFGQIEIARENYEKAIEYLIKAAEVNKRKVRPRAEYYLSIAYIKNAQPELAVPLLERITTSLESDFWFTPELILSHYHLGTAFEMKGQMKKAIEKYETFLDIWKDADTELDEIKDAKRRLAGLKS